MARKSKRRRQKLRQRNSAPVVMELVDGAPGVQKCPHCSTTVKDHAIKERICYRCSPKDADTQRKNHERPSEAPRTPQINGVSTLPENVSESSYGRSEAYLRSSCLDNSFEIPLEFENWQVYFWSKGSMLREWARWLNQKLLGRNASIMTDMTPHKDLERRIRERREATGKSGPGFKSILEQPSVSLHNNDPAERFWQKPSRKEPIIPRPAGMHGEQHLCI